MTDPTTQPEVLALMRESREQFFRILNRIPDERMTEIALYNIWSIKDFIAHIAWWEKLAAERMAIYRRHEVAPPMGDFDALNAEIHATYKSLPLDEVRAMEAEAFAALEAVVESMSDEDLFDSARYPTSQGRALIGWVEGDTWGHYDEHLPDVQAWMQQNNLA